MTMQDDNQGYPLPVQSAPSPDYGPTGEIARSGETAEEEIAESYNPPPVDENSDNYIPETGLTSQDEEDIFGTGERADGSMDEMERTDIDDLIGDDDDDYSDVLSVSEEDIMGKAPEPERPKHFKRIVRPNTPSAPTVGGMGGLQY